MHAKDPADTIRRSVLNLAVTLVLILLAAPYGGALAYGPYPANTTGTDISWPQCQNGLPQSPQPFAIIGVTGGRAFYQNPCLIAEFAWASTATTPPSFVMNLNAPGGLTAFKANSGPKGTCRTDDAICLSYNFGYNAARLAYADAQSQETSAPMWWLDVETENTWSDNTAANDQVIQGALDYLRGQGRTVGIYSTAMQWSQIAGSFSPGVPNWVAGAADAASAPDYCAASRAFGGGTVWLVQYTAGDFDDDYVCSAQPTTAVPSPPPTAPPTPAGFQTVAVNANSIQIMWSPATVPLSGYVISDGGTQVATLTGAATSYTVSGLTPGSYHCFAIAAVNGAGYSPWSPWSCVTLPAS